ncbi:uncharacterized protein LOC112494237 isoform X1 [Cephus cinctus]|uniref:Uncharacterized protein LOC112494237 isoform X1 n=1 Tax=Cephus cinctus TaxID=211228 RepID=A0AAJ7RFI8_CEPCN|nr:uncharacterized protein LOC112494237 isoform X1 [Cephus cinctus]
MPAVMKIGYSRNLPHPLGRENIFWKNKKGLWDFEQICVNHRDVRQILTHRDDIDHHGPSWSISWTWSLRRTEKTDTRPETKLWLVHQDHQKDLDIVDCMDLDLIHDKTKLTINM